MSKILSIDNKKKKKLTIEERLEFTLNMLTKLMADGVFTKKGELQLTKMTELEKMVLWELHGNLNGKKCTVKDLNGNILKKGVIELLFSESEDKVEYGIRILLDGEILRDIAFNEFFYVTADHENFIVEVLNGNDDFQIEIDGIIIDRDTALYSECFLKRIKMMKEYMTPEQNKEFDDMAIYCLSDMIEVDTGVKPEIEKEGDFIKVTTEEPTIN